MEFLGTVVNTKLSVRCSNLTQPVALERSLSVPKPDDFKQKTGSVRDQADAKLYRPRSIELVVMIFLLVGSQMG
jgi:hypothetical protein